MTRLLQTQQSIVRLFVIVLIVGFVGSCSSKRSVENRVLHADNIIHASKLKPLALITPNFALHSVYHFPKPGGLLTVYIEGDGRSWVSRFQLSSDPTPINPLALHLAIIHTEQLPNSNTAWLARPCQYRPNKRGVNCEAKYWSSHRFGEKVISSTNDAITQLMQKSGATKVRLIGFSGGAAVATLVAARRDDVEGIVSIAGNLDHQQVNKHHGVTPLRGSLNSKDVAQKLSKLPQVHFIGANDEVIPSQVADDFIKVQANKCAQKVIVPSAGHLDGWQDYWRVAVDRLDDDLSCSKNKLSVSF